MCFTGARAKRSLSLFDANAGDVTGYNPSRREFDPPYDIGAEQMIADIEFLDDDPEEVTRAKLKLLHLYRWRVHERERRHDFKLGWCEIAGLCLGRRF